MRVQSGDRDARPGDAEIARERRSRDADRLEQQRPRERGRHRRQRDVHGGRDDLELLGRQHHHRPRPRPAAIPHRQIGQVLGVPGVRQVRQIQRALGDRVRHQRQGRPARHGLDAALDGRDNGSIPAAGHRQHRQRLGECRPCFRGARNDRQRHVEAELARPRPDGVRVGVEHERGQPEPHALVPAHQRDVGPDAGRVAHRHRDRRQ